MNANPEPLIQESPAGQKTSAGFCVALISLYNTESNAIRTLHAVLEQAGFQVHTFFFRRRNPHNTFDRYSPDEVKHLVKHVRQVNPALVGISVMSAFFELASEITREIKSQSDTPVLWGGIHATIRPEQCLQVADMVCLGEGDEALVELVEKMSTGRPSDEIRNLWIRKGETIIRNELRPLIQDLDTIPFPDYSSRNKCYLEGGRISPCDYADVLSTLGLNFMTSRGCPFRCTFCGNGILRDLYKGKGRYVRQRSVEHVIRELEHLQKAYAPACIRFEDDVFSYHAEWVMDFCRQYKARIGLPFSCNGHPKTIKKEIVRTLKDAGLMHMAFGIQTGAERLRHAEFKRNETNEEIVAAAKTLNDLGVAYGCDLIVENPLETEEDRQETLALILRMPKPFFVNMHTLTHFPEYELTRHLLAAKRITAEDVEDHRRESFEQNRWNRNMDFSRDPSNMFWCALYYLAARRRPLSDRAILQISRHRLLRRHPLFLLLMIKLWAGGDRLLYLFWSGLKGLRRAPR